MPSMQFKITGLDCAEEVAVLNKELGDLVGGEACLTQTASLIGKPLLEMTIFAVPMAIFCAVMISVRTVPVRVIMIVASNVALAMSIIVSSWRWTEKGRRVVVPAVII